MIRASSRRNAVILGAPMLPVWMLLAVSTGYPVVTHAAQDDHKQVLILHSFGHGFGPYADVASSFQAELARLFPEPVEFFEVSLREGQSAAFTNDAPLVNYLESLLAEECMDLLVTVGGPAARFSLRQRERLFPSLPLLAAGVERPWAEDVSKAGNAAVVSIDLGLLAAIENILRVLPDTREIVVVLGASPNSQLSLADTRKELERFSHRVRFTWTNEWSLEEVLQRLKALPPHSVVFFRGLSVDAAGIPYPGRSALTRLHEAANAPVFGLFDTQLGAGIVGGPLLSLSEAGKHAGGVAARILGGQAPETISAPPVTMNVLAYDFRELERWGIRETLLPDRSQILFRPSSLWDEHRDPILVGISFVGLETALMGGLLLQLSRRRAAEEEARMFARRLLTAHEDERRRLAQELHEDLSQTLARIAIDAARMRQAPSSSVGELAVAMRDQLVRLSEHVHALSYRLHPSVLDDLGFKDALQVECDRFSRQESIRADLTSFEGPSELPSETALCLYRIAQEALRNVARHSGASRVSLAVTTTNGHLQMKVSDDGLGFAPRQRVTRSLGHASMRERARLVHGKLDIESAPGRGTTVTVSVPMKEGSP
ncbi:MAG TPA: ATP-binding protein [Vicinamibacteria bacterium]|nr:ATP-binding protein [Vicinamibacteria bacterium]